VLQDLNYYVAKTFRYSFVNYIKRIKTLRYVATLDISHPTQHTHN
jgi:hypothetical protein